MRQPIRILLAAVRRGLVTFRRWNRIAVKCGEVSLELVIFGDSGGMFDGLVL